MKTFKVYVDTSVFGGVFDDEFKNGSRSFFDLVRAGRFELQISDVCRKEIAGAPEDVRAFFDSVIAYLEVVPIDERVLQLRDAYVSAGVVGKRWLDDASHVAAAVVSGSELIVSWNFRHIVHFEKIRHYNQVNTRMGYREIEIRSPLEVLDYEDEEAV
ncbi:MAG: hypothetical protein IPK83_21705 [Planctomycetes bacterium]|nr:hypothetical protein [Planctomycetota bacterium]